PIVFEIGGDPVQSGLVDSLNRPGGNATGFTSLNNELTAKRIGLLHEALPQATRIAALVNPNLTAAEAVMKLTESAASSVGMNIEFFFARNSAEIDVAFANIAQKRLDALVGFPGGPFNERRVQVVTLVARHGLPAIFPTRAWAEAGALMSYSTI